jgi:hypothetical protein
MGGCDTGHQDEIRDLVASFRAFGCPSLLSPYEAPDRLGLVLLLSAVPQAYAWAPTILIYKLHPGGHQGQAYFGPGFVSTAQGAVLSLQALYRRDRDVGCSCQLTLRPSQKCAGSLNLPC